MDIRDPNIHHDDAEVKDFDHDKARDEWVYKLDELIQSFGYFEACDRMEDIFGEDTTLDEALYSMESPRVSIFLFVLA